MKKILFGVIAILAMVSCSGSGNGTDDKAREDSIRRADSIHLADSIAAVKSEQALQDSLRQDSIKNEEIFANGVKGLANLPDASNVDKYLKGLGFTGTTKKSTKKEYDDLVESEVEFDVIKCDYTLTAGNKTIKYQMDMKDSLSWGESKTKVTIEGDDEALENFYKHAKNEDGEVTKKGNTVIITKGWA